MNTAADQLESRLTFDAVARRRRMRDRQAKRRLSQIALVTTAVFAAASLFSPERPAVRSASIAPNARGPLTTARLSANAAASASLPLPPSWRPAGEVLKRKATKAPTLPFGVDPRDVARRESLSRWHGIYAYATRYRLKPDLSRRIYDAAVTAGLEPELAFRLVRVESVFESKALSPVGAIGLTQLMLGTARAFEPSVTREQLFDADVNLRIGFRYLRSLIRDYKGNLKLALLVYNRGPVAVQNALSLGIDPTNGYESLVIRGYRGRGILD